MRRFAAALVLAALWALPAAAQTAVPITTCGTLPKNYTLGGPRDLTQTLTGQLCVNPFTITIGSVAISGTVTLSSTQPTLTTTLAALEPTLTTTVTGTVSVNETQLAGQSISLNSGATDAGTQRVVLGNTEPTLTTTLAATQPTLTTTVSGTVTLNNTEPTLTTTMGCTATSTLPAVAATPGATVIPICDTMQRIIVALWSDRGAMVRGKALPASTASTTIIAANATNKIYVTGIQCWNPGVTSTLATFNDSASTSLFLPAGGGNNFVHETPLVGQAINSAFQMALSLSSSAVGCNAQGFLGG